jgi:glycine dehydrogenase subunit 2
MTKALEPLIYEMSVPGRCGALLPDVDVPETDLPADLLRTDLDLPEVSEMDVIRHYLRLSQLNYAIDKGFYPLGSCTMKYNPKVNEDAARLPGFAGVHPHLDIYESQGALMLMHYMQTWLAEISGMQAASVQPAAGAQGEFTGILMIRQYHLDRGDTRRTKILVPNSAHGTNPATVSMVGYEVVELPSDENGDVDLDALRAACDDTVAGMMITVPSTLGLFEGHMLDVVEAVHDCGGLMYMDGANMNAMMGILKPGEIGFDVMHYNLHKTFSTPHGGGGPGSGPVACNDRLKPFLPGPVVAVVEDENDEQGPLFGWQVPEKSIGRVKAFNGNFGMLVRAFAYIMINGASGIRDVSRYAVLNANYLRVQLRDTYHVPHDRYCGHEFVMEGAWDDVPDIHALDISKRLMDYGFHPPTNYFPLIVHEALMIEPTETEAKETLDEFVTALKAIAKEAHETPDLLHEAPHDTPVGRVDEVLAAKQLQLCCVPIPNWSEVKPTFKTESA